MVLGKNLNVNKSTEKEYVRMEIRGGHLPCSALVRKYVRATDRRGITCHIKPMADALERDVLPLSADSRNDGYFMLKQKENHVRSMQNLE